MTTFADLKNDRRASTERLLEHILEEEYRDRGLDDTSPSLPFNQLSRRERLAAALISQGRGDLFQRITDCRPGSRCNSLWCRTCRSTVAQSNFNHVMKKVRRDNLTNDDLIHITAPVALCNVNAQAVQDALELDQKRWRRIRRRNGFWLWAAYEFELVDRIRLMVSNNSPEKKKQMQQMLNHQEQRLEQQFLFVHWHGLAALNPETLKSIFGAEYLIGDRKLHKTSDTGIYQQKLHRTKSIEKNVKTITSYSFKDPYNFKHSFFGSDYKSGEPFAAEELGKLVCLYQDVQGRQWRSLIRSTDAPPT